MLFESLFSHMHCSPKLAALPPTPLKEVHTSNTVDIKQFTCCLCVSSCADLGQCENKKRKLTGEFTARGHHVSGLLRVPRQPLCIDLIEYFQDCE